MSKISAVGEDISQEVKDREYTKVWDKMLSRVPDGLFKFEKFGAGYRAVLPACVSYRNKESRIYPVKSRFVVCVFESLLKQNMHIISRMSSAAILFIFHLKRHFGIVRDNDNSDGHDIINLVNKYILSTDDSGLTVSLAYESCVSELDIPYTEVYILPKVDLLERIGGKS